MDEPNKAAMMTKLLAVQRAKRDAAESALAAARAEEHAARAEEEEALRKRQSAQEQWMAYIADPGFSPDYSRFLSSRLIDRAAEAERAVLRTGSAADRSAARQREWQLLEAQLSSGKESLKRLGRKIERRAEERRLAAHADRTTYSWCRA